MAFPEFGKWCNCTGYLAKDKNEICILASPPVIEWENRPCHYPCFEEIHAHIRNPNGVGYADVPIDWEEDVEKPLRRVVSKKFCGVIVGKQTVTVKENLYVMHEDHPYYGEYDYVEKRPSEQAECYIVFFANNRKRFVPVEMAQIITKE